MLFYEFNELEKYRCGFEQKFEHSFPLLSECSNVLQMALAITVEPTIIDELCPRLPPHFVLRLLGNQQPDDLLPLPNNLSIFMSAYPKANTQPDLSISPLLSFELNEVAKIIPFKTYQDIKFEDTFCLQFPFLFKYSNSSRA